MTNTALTETMLISTTILKLKNQVFNNAPFTTSFVPNYALSGNKLCYASNESSGLVTKYLIIVPNTFKIELATMDMGDLFVLLLVVLSIS